MNFDFKSTFNTNITACFQAIRRIPHVGWILLINSIAAVSAAYLYLGNYVIPATIGSKYHGDHYITMIETAMYLHFISSAYAFAHLGVHAIVNRVNYTGSDIFILKLFYSIRQSSAIIMILLHLGRFIPRPGYTLQKETARSLHFNSPEENFIN